MGILDYIFPKRCVVCKRNGSYLCAKCFSFLSFETESFCLMCHKLSFDGLTHSKCLGRYDINGCFSALSNSKTAQKLLYSFKQKPYLTDLKNVLTDLFYESLIQNEGFNNELKKGKWVFVPIPLEAAKFRKRGYNQAEILATELSKRFNLPLANLPPEKESSRNIILVDDLVKTGSTLKEATKAFKKRGAKRVIGVTLVRG